MAPRERQQQTSILKKKASVEKRGVRVKERKVHKGDGFSSRSRSGFKYSPSRHRAAT